MTPTRTRTTLAALLVALALTSGAAGALLVTASRQASGADIGQVPDGAGPPAGGTAPRVAAAPAPEPGDRPGAPVRLLIDAAGLAATVVPVGAGGDGELAVPDEPRTVGWWVGSDPAGDPRGSTVLVGHVDSASRGLGALAVLRTLRPGTRIVLTDVFGARHAYTLAARRSYPKRALPADVLRGRSGPRLVLVTCAGPFDQASRTYRDNLVVYAVPA